MIKPRYSAKSRTGFTLVELLIVITIMLLILSITIYSVNSVNESQRVQGGAAQVQSFLAGARDRAIFEKEPRGVRFFSDPNNPRGVSAMAYIKPGEKWNVGNVSLQRLDLDGDNVADGPDVTVVAGDNLGWWQLKRRGLITDGSVIEIPRGSDNFYEIDTSLINILNAPGYAQSPPRPEYLLLRIPYSEPGGGDLSSVVAHPNVTYEIQLPSQLLPQEPTLLPENVIIDLDGSNVPIAWRPSPADSEGQFSAYMDVFFSPRGNVIGSASSVGLLHLYVCDNEDSLLLKELYLGSIDASAGINSASPLDTFEGQVRSSTGKFIPADEAYGAWTDPDGTGAEPPLFTAAEPYLMKDRRIVTVFTQTGAVIVNRVASTDLDGDGFADAPFSLSESGIGAK